MGSLILLTGATGFLGSGIARLILEDTDYSLAVLVRGRDDDDAVRRLGREWSGWFENNDTAVERIRVIRGDLSLPRLGICPVTYKYLIGNLTHIIHAAAGLGLTGDLRDLRRINVDGTAGLLDLARQVHRDHGLERFAHISTAYVAGRREGEIPEEELTDTSGFYNIYERTKFEGESLVYRAMKDLPVSIFRPGMVIGDSQTGEIRSFNTVYVPLKLYLTGNLPFVPARPDLPLNIVPSNYVIGAVTRLTFDRRAEGLTFHLTVAGEYLPETREILAYTRKWAIEHLGEDPGPGRFIPLPLRSGGPAARLIGVPDALIPYFSERRSYRRENTDRLLGEYRPEWKDILPKILEYAVSCGFLHRTGRTVHEQILQRLHSTRLPLRVHDLGGSGRGYCRSGAEMSREIGLVISALGALGIRPGDRIALVGHNTSRFLSLDTAIGLIGAVSVPLYYTSPIYEIEEILKASGARALLVGTPALIARVNQLDFPIPVISFCDSPVTADAAGRVLSWDAFLEGGGRSAAISVSASPVSGSPVGFSDLATVRFTSGTTGSPKGVTFLHGQVRWLAETIAAIMPWKVRISPARYLSFLPMNHVVEGILGTYAPAYIPAPVDIYFLEDFQRLSEVLPQVRPTVFFSVPRFYEKVWERFTGTRAGSGYLSLSPRGLLRRLARPILRQALLRKIGLDKCTQLIVGSAPCPVELIDAFRDLGVEIHNAYGLTEAPLITMNRYGSNNPETVGTPLPETRVRIADDGEILVMGPQVTGGYFGEFPTNINGDHWFHTGDLGEIDSRGRLTLRGRKKDLIITSYGKNIYPGKIEGMLRRIPGIAEAMVIGDDRPSLTALLWPADSSESLFPPKEIDAGIERMNASLSNPERIKRWVLLSESPSIDSGELTGNLKLRRQIVLDRWRDVVETIYRWDTSDVPDGIALMLQVRGVLHLGGFRCA